MRWLRPRQQVMDLPSDHPLLARLRDDDAHAGFWMLNLGGLESLEMQRRVGRIVKSEPEKF